MRVAWTLSTMRAQPKTSAPRTTMQHASSTTTIAPTPNASQMSCEINIRCLCEFIRVFGMCLVGNQCCKAVKCQRQPNHQALQSSVRIFDWRDLYIFAMLDAVRSFSLVPQVPARARLRNRQTIFPREQKVIKWISTLYKIRYFRKSDEIWPDDSFDLCGTIQYNTHKCTLIDTLELF